MQKKSPHQPNEEIEVINSASKTGLQAMSERDLDTTRKIRIVIVDDAPYFRTAIRDTLGRLPGFEIVGEAADARKGIEIAEKNQPDVILMDYALPGMNGLVACRRIKESRPEVQIVLFSMFADDVKMEAAKAGACLCIGKDTEIAKLADLVIGCSFSGVVL